MGGNNAVPTIDSLTIYCLLYIEGLCCIISRSILFSLHFSINFLLLLEAYAELCSSQGPHLNCSGQCLLASGNKATFECMRTWKVKMIRSSLCIVSRLFSKSEEMNRVKVFIWILNLGFSENKSYTLWC